MTTALIKTYQKYAVEKRQLVFDYSCWLDEGEELTGFQVSVNPYTAGTPLTVTGTYTDAAHTKLAMMVGGGLANTMYTLSMVVTTDVGQIKRDDIGVRVTS